MFPYQTGYRYSESDIKKSIIENLKDEYSEYLSNLSIDKLREIARSDHFQLMEEAINTKLKKLEQELIKSNIFDEEQRKAIKQLYWKED